MANSVFPNVAVIVAVFAISIATVIVVKGDVNINPMIAWCNLNKFEATDLYAESVHDVRSVLPKTDPSVLRRVGGRYFYSAWNGSTCFGHASCKDTLVDGDCTQCLTKAAALTEEKCGSSVGAQIELPECRIRYEPYNFTE